MARILVQTDDSRQTVLDERQVRQVQLQSELSAAQLLERIAWAIDDAEGRLGKGPGTRRWRSPYRGRGRGHVTAVESAVGRTFD